MNRVFAFAFAIAILTLTIASCGGGGTSDELRITSADQTVVVSDTALNGWFEVNQSNSDVTFVNGPGIPPAGTGSVQFSTGATGSVAPVGGKPTLGTSQFDGQLLSDIETLTYSTYVSQVAPTHTHLAVPIKLQVDTDGDGDRDTTLVFEPVYVVGEQGPVLLNTWQEWDTLDGNGWWNTSAVAGYPGGGSTFFSLADFAAAYPEATIVNWHTGVEGAGFNFSAGQNSGGFWSDFVGNVDKLEIGFGGDTTTFDFELTTKDACKNGGWKALGFKNQGECVSAHTSQGKNK
jgi:hypothetical protein